MYAGLISPPLFWECNFRPRLKDSFVIFSLLFWALDLIIPGSSPLYHYHVTCMVSAGSTDEAWYDSLPIFESDCDEDYKSVADDVLSLSGFEGVSRQSTASLRDSMHAESNTSLQHVSSLDHVHKPGDMSIGNSAHNSVSEVARNSMHHVLNSDDTDSHHKPCEHPSEAKKPVFLDDISSGDENSGKEEGLLDNCGIIPNNCLPCLASTVPSVEKRRSLSSSPPSARKKSASKLSFKWKDAHSNGTLCEYRYLALLLT